MCFYTGSKSNWINRVDVGFAHVTIRAAVLDDLELVKFVGDAREDCVAEINVWCDQGIK